MTLETTNGENQIMKGIMGFYGDDYPHLDNGMPTPQNYADYVGSVASKGTGDAIPLTDLEAGIVTVDNDRATRDNERTQLKALHAKVNGGTDLTKKELRKALKHLLKGL